MQDPSTAFQGIRPPPPAGTAQFTPPDQHHQQQQQQQEHLKCPRCDSTNTKFCYYNNYNLSQPRHFCKSCRRYWTKGGALRNIPVGGGTRKNSKRTNSSGSSTGRGGGGNNNNNSNSTNSPPVGATGSTAKRPNTSSRGVGSTSATTLPTTQIRAAAAAPHATLSGHISFAPPPPTLHLPAMYPSTASDQERQLLDIGAAGSFSSLLASTAHFGGLIDHTAFHHVSGDLAAHLGASTSTGLELLGPGNGDDNDNPPHTAQNPQPGTSSTAAENFMGLHGVSGCWDDDGRPDGGVGGGDGTGAGWPGLSIYTPGSNFR